MRHQLAGSFILSCICLTSAVGEVYYAVNCGGPLHFSRADNVLYIGDVGYSGGVAAAARSALSALPGIEDATIYQTSREQSEEIRYRIPVRQMGEFVLVLKFSEAEFDSAGHRVFDVVVGGIPVIHGLDPYTKAGGKALPHEEFVGVYRRPQSLEVEGQLATEAGWDLWSEEVIVLLKKRSDAVANPSINAIVVYHASKENVPRLRQKFDEAVGRHRSLREGHATFAEPQCNSEMLSSSGVPWGIARISVAPCPVRLWSTGLPRQQPVTTTTATDTAPS